MGSHLLLLRSLRPDTGESFIEKVSMRASPSQLQEAQGFFSWKNLALVLLGRLSGNLGGSVS